MARRHKIGGYTMATIDMLTALLVVFMAMALLATIAQRKQADPGIHAGALIVTLQWQQDRDADVDLWVRPPGDSVVGYSAATDGHCDLLRDDLGRSSDPSSNNSEVVICRAAPAGEWVVNVMAYASHDGMFPIAALVMIKRLDDGGMVTLLERKFVLTFQGQQLTLWRFTLDREARIVTDSVGCVPTALYSAVPAECAP